VSPDPRLGLCPGCAHVKLVRNDRGSVFLLCRLAARDPRLPKYPTQPRLLCPGHEPSADPGGDAPGPEPGRRG
jgi:hypothetical protein